MTTHNSNVDVHQLQIQLQARPSNSTNVLQGADGSPPSPNRDSIQTQSDPLTQQTVNQGRNSFIAKVFALLVLQLIISTGMTVSSYYSQTFSDFLMDHLWLYILTFVFMVAGSVLTMCFQKCRKAPLDVIIYSVFTLAFSYNNSYASVYYSQKFGSGFILVVQFIALGAISSLTLYSCGIRQNFKTKRGIIVVVVVSLILFGVLIAPNWSSVGVVFACSIFAMIAIILAMLDTQAMFDDDRDIKMTSQDYVAGNMMLFCDLPRVPLYFVKLIRNKCCNKYQEQQK